MLSGINFNFASGQRSVELSRIDHGASLAADPSLDAVNNNTGDDVPDGLVDIASMQSPFCVWVVVDRFDLGEGLDSTSDRFLSGTDDDQFRQETTPEVGTTPGRQTTDFPRDWPSNDFARLLNPFLPVSNSQESPETATNSNFEAPLSLFLVQNPPGQPPTPSGGPLVEDGTVTRRFPSVVDQNDEALILPDSVADTSVAGNTRRFAYIPGIFPPLNIVLNGDRQIDFIGNDETSASQYVPVDFSQANTFVQAFGVRRGWTIDSNAKFQTPVRLVSIL